MTLYHVHLYREMRLYFPGVEADTPEQAARIAADRPTFDAEHIEDCNGETLAALIDVAPSSVISSRHQRPRTGTLTPPPIA